MTEPLSAQEEEKEGSPGAHRGEKQGSASQASPDAPLPSPGLRLPSLQHCEMQMFVV